MIEFFRWIDLKNWGSTSRDICVQFLGSTSRSNADLTLQFYHNEYFNFCLFQIRQNKLNFDCRNRLCNKCLFIFSFFSVLFVNKNCIFSLKFVWQNYAQKWRIFAEKLWFLMWFYVSKHAFYCCEHTADTQLWMSKWISQSIVYALCVYYYTRLYEWLRVATVCITTKCIVHLNVLIW